MAEAKDKQGAANSFSWSMVSLAGNPLLAVVTDINGKLLETVASAQKDWAEFVHRRVKEDVAASQQLIKCQSLIDMHQICSQYFQTAFQQYREQSERAAQRSRSMTEVLGQTVDARGREITQRTQH